MVTESDGTLRVLVVDDDANWVDTLVAQFQHRSIHARGVSKPSELIKWTHAARFDDLDMIFLDMRLGISETGAPITAADVLLHLMTYSPTAKVAIFTQKDITVEECLRCIQLGALGIFPKSSEVDHFILVAKVYRHVGDESKAREERIRSLWAILGDKETPAKGRQLELLMINVFNSIEGFRVVGHNKEILAGELDFIVENEAGHKFWAGLESFHLVIECKNEASTSEKKDFNILAAKVRTKDRCTVGILVSMAGVSGGFRELQSARAAADPRVFYLDRANVEGVIRHSASDREEYLRHVLERQL